MKKNRETIVRAILTAASACTCIGVLFCAYTFGPANAINNLLPFRRADMLDTTLKWARLAPLPENINGFFIRAEGTPFTRSYRTQFYATPVDIAAWVNASPGLMDARITTNPDGIQQYIIAPGGGASYAEVIIDDRQNLVKIYVA